MAINKIDYDLCIGCGKCVNACRYDVLRMNAQTKKPAIVYRDECVLCNQCMKDCPVSAIELVPGVRIPCVSFFGY